MRALKGIDRSRILDAIEEQLLYQPQAVTRNKKLLRPNPIAPWELRVRNLRIFYDVDEHSKTVEILAIGEKIGNTLFIDDKEIQL